MALVEAFIAELQQEAQTTRRVLERVPDAHLTWRPHAKSMTLGELAHHIARLPLGITDLITPLETEVPIVPLIQPSSTQEILDALDHAVPYAVEKLAIFGDAGLHAMWRMTRDGRVLLEMPRMAMFRSVMLNHWYHHRGQLTVYLRMHDVPLPSVYGPTADEQVFG